MVECIALAYVYLHWAAHKLMDFFDDINAEGCFAIITFASARAECRQGPWIAG